MRGERKRETLNLGARALPAEVGAHGHLCTRSRYRLTLNQPERQVPWKAACSLRCSPASLILLSWPLVFLLPRLSFWKRLPCTGQSTSVRRHIYAKPCVIASILFTAASLAGRESLQSGWASFPALPPCLCATAPARYYIGRGSRNQQVKQSADLKSC